MKEALWLWVRGESRLADSSPDNLFLQGDPRRGESAIDPARVVADARIGAAIAQGRWRFTYTLVMRSREFGGPNAVRYPALAFAGATLSY